MPRPGAPSCFSASFTNADGSVTGCHAQGPGRAPHALPFADPALHGPEALNAQAFCQQCHGTPGTTAFAGGSTGVACSQAGCHPAAGAHPTRWQGNDDVTPAYLASHQLIDGPTVAESCAICHRTDAAGAGANPGAPSCFSPSFTNADGSPSGCHARGPGTPSHALPYAAPAEHGPEAKRDLSFCQTCHGAPRTTGFAGGFTGVACSLCHPEARAHPATWQGTNDDALTNGYASTHRNAGSTTTACAICHNVAQAGPGPDPAAPSCFSADFRGLDCHATCPGAPHDLGSGWLAPAGHGLQGKQDLAGCQVCHGAPGTTLFDGGTAATACSACHLAAGAHPTRWQGTNDVTVDHLASHRTSRNQGTACVLCHDVTQGRTAPNPLAPSCLSTGFTNAEGSRTGCHPSGPGAPHALPFVPLVAGENVAFALHGAEAKGDLTFCRQCHATPFDGGPGANPRFNLPLGRLANGCETCHDARTAHPVPWAQGVVADHMEFGNKEVACALCHGATLRGPAEGGVGPACVACHTGGSPLVVTACASCHNTPPNALAPVGAGRPNREGAHLEHGALPRVAGNCGTCHYQVGSGTARHFDPASPADVAFLPQTYNAKTGGLPVRNATGTCSNVSCHGGQTTPVWATGVLVVNTQCTSCHRHRNTSDQHNSNFSGDHEVGDHLSAGCTACHNVTTLAVNHFTTLDTPAMEGPASATIGGGTTEIPAGGWVAQTRSCSPNCHGEETW
ncbi:MAG: CxxxxCH/CxxCH domain c-type cytochrome [Deferrisomatales bacterium]